MIFEDMDNWVGCEVRNAAVWNKVNAEGLRMNFDLRPDVQSWLVERLGGKMSMRHIGVWTHDIPILSKTTIFSFKDENEAILFKLTWG